MVYGIWYENGIHSVFAYVLHVSCSGCLQHSASIPCLIVTFRSTQFQIIDGVFTVTVKSEKNSDPDFGPTEYTVTIFHAPTVKRKGRGRGPKRKNELSKPVLHLMGCESILVPY